MTFGMDLYLFYVVNGEKWFARPSVHHGMFLNHRQPQMIHPVFVKVWSSIIYTQTKEKMILKTQNRYWAWSSPTMSWPASSLDRPGFIVGLPANAIRRLKRRRRP